MRTTDLHTAISTTWVPAGPSRAHVRHLLLATGLPWRVLAVVAHVPTPVVGHLVHGRQGIPQRRLRLQDARALADLTHERLQRLRVELVAAPLPREATAWLLARYPTSTVTDWLDASEGELVHLLDSRTHACRAITAARALAVAEQQGWVPSAGAARPSIAA